MADPGAVAFRDGPRLSGPQVAAVAAVVLVATVAVQRALHDGADLSPLAFLLVGGLGFAFVAWAGSWTELRLDPAQRLVHTRIGWLRWSTSSRQAFDAFDRVVVAQATASRSQAATSPGSQGQKVATATRIERRLVLALAGPAGAHETVPMPRDAGPEALEAAALQLAVAGGWPAFRIGWRLEATPHGPVIVWETGPPSMQAIIPR